MNKKTIIIEVQDYIDINNVKYQLQKNGIEVLSIKVMKNKNKYRRYNKLSR